jgi:purine-nucleoside phosphorylase
VSRRPPPAELAVVFGSGLALVPEGAELLDEIDYRDLGWPVTSVAGHPNRLLLVHWAPDGHVARRVLLAWGRPHLYEGWTDAELERPVDDLADAGARALLLTNAVGGLEPTLATGQAVVVTSVVDLQHEPRDRAASLPVTSAAAARRLAAALSPRLPARAGRYVAVPGPQYETPAEAAWLRGFGEVVGMSGASEVRAAGRRGLPVGMLSIVANSAGAALDHAEVLATGERLGARLAAGLATLAGAFTTPGSDPGRAGPARPGAGARRPRGGTRKETA